MTNTKGTDRLLIKQCIRGNTRAQLGFYKQYYTTMFHTALRITQNKTNAEDIMQEAFINAFNNLKDTYTPDLNIEAWLRRIVINKSIDFLREKTQNITLTTVNELADVSITPEEPDNLEQVELEVNAVKKALQELPEGYRLICSLYLFEGYDHEEIAEILNISASTSRSQFYRAKKQLLTKLKNTPSHA